MEPRPSTALTTVLPRKRTETSRPPKADSRAERAVGVVAKAPTAKPPTAPTVAPSTNLVVPWPKPGILPALASSDGASLAQQVPRQSGGVYCSAHGGDGEKGTTPRPARRGRCDARPVGIGVGGSLRSGFGDGGRARGAGWLAAPHRGR